MAVQSVSSVVSLFEVLADDTHTSLKRAETSGEQVDRRAYIRALFAFVEVTNHLWCVGTMDLSPELTRSEQGCLLDETHYIGDNGEVKTRALRPPMLNHLKFAFSAFAKASGSKYRLDLSEVGWDDFVRTKRVRDRLTHPRQPGDIEVSDDEFSTAIAAMKWFYKVSYVSYHNAKTAWESAEQSK